MKIILKNIDELFRIMTFFLSHIKKITCELKKYDMTISTKEKGVISMRCVKLKYIEIISIQDILIFNINLQEIASF